MSSTPLSLMRARLTDLDTSDGRRESGDGPGVLLPTASVRRTLLPLDSCRNSVRVRGAPVPPLSEGPPSRPAFSSSKWARLRASFVAASSVCRLCAATGGVGGNECRPGNNTRLRPSTRAPSLPLFHLARRPQCADVRLDLVPLDGGGQPGDAVEVRCRVGRAGRAATRRRQPRRSNNWVGHHRYIWAAAAAIAPGTHRHALASSESESCLGAGHAFAADKDMGCEVL